MSEKTLEQLRVEYLDIIGTHVAAEDAVLTAREARDNAWHAYNNKLNESKECEKTLEQLKEEMD